MPTSEEMAAKVGTGFASAISTKKMAVRSKADRPKGQPRHEQCEQRRRSRSDNTGAKFI
ncbi:MAG: hypothetical protein AAGK17_14515 [Pseudomonadota bacterium]